MVPPVRVYFAGGSSGPLRVDQLSAVRGEGLAPVARIAVHERAASAVSNASWVLSGTTGHVRYVEKIEKLALAAVQPPLGRPQATCAALIPIRKSDAWWELAQDERRALLEQQSRHIQIGMRYLPAIARRLIHSRELGGAFDFLTYFEYAPEHATLFEELVAALRESQEWHYVEREVDVRMTREPS